MLHLVFGLLAAAGGQAVATSFDGSSLVPYTNLWKVVITSKGRPHYMGTWSDEVKRVKRNGGSAMLREQVFKVKNGATNTFITVFDPASMRPYSSSFLTSDGDAVLRQFQGDAVVIVDASGDNRGMPSRQTVNVKERAYDFNAGMYGIMFAGLPLRAGLSGIIPTYGQTDASLEHVTYAVRKKETVQAKPGTTVEAWVVDAHYLDAHRPEGDARMRFWIAEKAPYIIKLVYDVPSTGQTWVYTMV
jgi:hypothetical protein